MSLAKAICTTKNQSYVPLQKLSQDVGNSAILVRVSRLWEAYNLKNNKDLISTDMVMIDEEGSYIHGSIKGNLSHLFRDAIVEGGIYLITNFEIVDNKTTFRVVGDNKIMIQLNANSRVRPAPDKVYDIAMHRFDFIEFDKVPMRMGQHYILTDVVGQVCSEGEVMDKNVHDRTVKCLMLELQDLRGSKLRITLWGKSVEDYITQKTALEGSVIVGVFTSNLVKEYMSKFYSHENELMDVIIWIFVLLLIKIADSTILSSTTATKVYLDLAIGEVDALKNKYSEMCKMKPLLVQSRIVDRATVLSGLKTIAEILDIASTDFENGAMFYCHALIYDINNKNGWYYNSCGDCKGIVKPSGTKFWCKKDKKLVADAVPRYRLEAVVKDETDTTKFIIFDDEAEKIIGQSAISLYDMNENHEDEDTEGQLPAFIGNVIGQRYVFHVKLTEYNKTAYTQSFAASKVFRESILGPLKKKQTPDHASTSGLNKSTITDNVANKKRRLSVKTHDDIENP